MNSQIAFGKNYSPESVCYQYGAAQQQRIRNVSFLTAWQTNINYSVGSAEAHGRRRPKILYLAKQLLKFEH
jgi:hypothetical protein